MTRRAPCNTSSFGAAELDQEVTGLKYFTAKSCLNLPRSSNMIKRVKTLEEQVPTRIEELCRKYFLHGATS